MRTFKDMRISMLEKRGWYFHPFLCLENFENIFKNKQGGMTLP